MKTLKSLLMALSFVMALTTAFAFTTSTTACEGTDRKYYDGTFTDPNEDEDVELNMKDVETGYGCDETSAICTWYLDGDEWVPCPGEPEGVYIDPPTK